MLCATCGRETIVDPCGGCGQPALLAGRFVLLAIVGSGAAGTTYRATDGKRDVAIKEMPLRLAESEKARQLLSREASVLRQVRHGGVPTFYEDFLAGEGKLRALYLVQEFIEGQTLAAEAADTRYGPAEALAVAAELLGILAHLHGLSPPVVHRDIKPANVMRRPDGRLVLIDFGAVRDALQDSRLGGSTVAGTFGYMAPEQFQGDAWPATDLYGVAALVVSLLARRPPHTMLDHHGQIRWRSRLSCPAPLAGWLEAMLQPDPRRRPSSTAEALAMTRRALADLAAAPELEPEPPRSPQDLPVRGPVLTQMPDGRWLLSEDPQQWLAPPVDAPPPAPPPPTSLRPASLRPARSRRISALAAALLALPLLTMAGAALGSLLPTQPPAPIQHVDRGESLWQSYDDIIWHDPAVTQCLTDWLRRNPDGNPDHALAVRVTLYPSEPYSRWEIQPGPFDGTSLRACVEARLHEVQLPPSKETNVTVIDLPHYPHASVKAPRHRDGPAMPEQDLEPGEPEEPLPR